METLIALTGPTRQTVGQTAQLSVHKTLSNARDSQATAQKSVMELKHAQTLGTSCSPLARLSRCLALSRPASIRARTALDVLISCCFVILSKTATAERMKRPSIAKLSIMKTKTKPNVSIIAQRAGLSTRVTRMHVSGVLFCALPQMSRCVRTAAT